MLAACEAKHPAPFDHFPSLPATSAVLAQALLSHDSWWVMKMH
jgi:hypothetical protein